jgi:hypothetical protein
MKKRTCQLRDLVKALGVLVVVLEPQKFSAAAFSEIPSESFTKSCRQDGLAETMDADFQFSSD